MQSSTQILLDFNFFNIHSPQRITNISILRTKIHSKETKLMQTQYDTQTFMNKKKLTKKNRYILHEQHRQ